MRACVRALVVSPYVSTRTLRYTAAHPVVINVLFLKDFEVSYVQRAFRGMDVTRSTFLKRSVLVPASAQLSGDLRDRFDAFGDEYVTDSFHSQAIPVEY